MLSIGLFIILCLATSTTLRTSVLEWENANCQVENGLPCKLPFYFGGRMHYGCISNAEEREWCIVRNSRFLSKRFACRKQCPLARPSLIQGPNIIYKPKHVIFECWAVGSPNPIISWRYKDEEGHMIQHKEPTLPLQDSPPRITFSQLVINQPLAGVFNYCCEASNAFSVTPKAISCIGNPERLTKSGNSVKGWFGLLTAVFLTVLLVVTLIIYRKQVNTKLLYLRRDVRELQKRRKRNEHGKANSVRLVSIRRSSTDTPQEVCDHNRKSSTTTPQEIHQYSRGSSTSSNQEIHHYNRGSPTSTPQETQQYNQGSSTRTPEEIHHYNRRSSLQEVCDNKDQEYYNMRKTSARENSREQSLVAQTESNQLQKTRSISTQSQNNQSILSQQEENQSISNSLGKNLYAYVAPLIVETQSEEYAGFDKNQSMSTSLESVSNSHKKSVYTQTEGIQSESHSSKRKKSTSSQSEGDQSISPYAALSDALYHISTKKCSSQNPRTVNMHLKINLDNESASVNLE